MIIMVRVPQNGGRQKEIREYNQIYETRNISDLRDKKEI